MRTLALLLCAGGLAVAQNPITWTLAGAPVKPGATATASLKATIEPGWHLYGLTQPQDGPKATRIWLPDDQPYKLRNEIKAPKPLRELDPNFGLEVEFYEKEATFRIPVKLEGAAGTPLKVNVNFQSCNDKICLPPRTVTVTPSR